MNVTFVKLPMVFSSWVGTRVQDLCNTAPLGLLSLAGSVRAITDKIRIIDMSAGDILTESVLLDTDILGVGASTRDFQRAIEFLQKAKVVNPQIKTILGGPHISLCSENIAQCDFIDYLVIGEGEQALPKIVRGKATQRILQEPAIKNLDTLPFPAYDLINITKYHFAHCTHLYTLEASRGCPFNCLFCSERKLYGTGYRTKSNERIIKELQTFNPKFMIFADSNFAGDIPKTMNLCKAMVTAGTNNAMYMGHIRVDTVVKYPELVEQMERAGFTAFWMGIESPLEKSLKYYRKGVDWQQIKKAKQILDDHGILLIAELIIGALDETEEDIRNYTRLIQSLDLDLFFISILTPMPGTDLTQQINNRIFIRDWQYYDHTCCVFEHPNIPFQRLNRLPFIMTTHLLYDPISIIHRGWKLARLYLKKYAIINDLLDTWKLSKTFLWDVPKFLFWDSNKYVKHINTIFVNELQKSKTNIRRNNY